MEQNTSDWLEYRKNGIGASDMNAIMGVSPYSTPLDIYKEKIGEKSTRLVPKFVTMKGHELEVIARNRFEIERSVVAKEKLVEHSDFPHFRASLDGYIEEENACWECKYIGKDLFEGVKNNILPEKYKPQIHWQIFVSGASKSYLTCINDEHEIATMEIAPDIDYMKTLFEEAVKFWECVKSKTPPKLDHADKVEIKNQEINQMLKAYKEKKEKVDSLTKEQEALKSDIFKLLKHTNSFSIIGDDKFSVQKQETKGRVNYKFLFYDYDIPENIVEKYRGKPSSKKVIRITKVKK